MFDVMYITRHNLDRSMYGFLRFELNGFFKASTLPWRVHLVAERWATSKTEKANSRYETNKNVQSSTTGQTRQWSYHCKCREGNARRSWGKVNYAIFIMLISSKLPLLEEKFEQLLDVEANWPTPLPCAKDLYMQFFNAIGQLIHNIVCASCGCINHQFDSCEFVPTNYEPLRLLAVPVDINILFDFSCLWCGSPRWAAHLTG